jgi:hypothetical protein
LLIHWITTRRQNCQIDLNFIAAYSSLSFSV